MNDHIPDGIVCSGLVKEFNDGAQTIQVLRGVNAHFAPGQLSLLVGPSGCGKTTLISIIAGTLSATRGEVSVFGQSVTQMKRTQLERFRRERVGFIFQQYNLLPTLTAEENASVALVAAGMGRRLALESASHMLDRLGLGDQRRKLPAQLSGGQQQRVAIARALVHEPPLVVCDEPTSALDAKTGHTVMTLLREVAIAKDRACIVVTHDSRIFDLADRIVRMEDGQVSEQVADGQRPDTP